MKLLDWWLARPRWVFTAAMALGVLFVLLGLATEAQAQLTQEEARENWLAALGDIAWLLWFLCFLLTRFIRSQPLRVLGDLAMGGILGLPIGPEARFLAATGGGLVILFDCLDWAGLIPKSISGRAS